MDRERIEGEVRKIIQDLFDNPQPRCPQVVGRLTDLIMDRSRDSVEAAYARGQLDGLRAAEDQCVLEMNDVRCLDSVRLSGGSHVALHCAKRIHNLLPEDKR